MVGVEVHKSQEGGERTDELGLNRAHSVVRAHWDKLSQGDDWDLEHQIAGLQYRSNVGMVSERVPKSISQHAEMRDFPHLPNHPI
jgi:hypothetical protein